jgi:hypothetical protein
MKILGGELEAMLPTCTAGSKNTPGDAPAVAEGEYRWHLSTSFNYLKGDYGTGEDTEVIYVPFTFGVRLDRFRLSLTLPYLRQTSQNVVLTGGGVAAKKKNQPSPSATSCSARRISCSRNGRCFPRSSPT